MNRTAGDLAKIAKLGTPEMVNWTKKDARVVIVYCFVNRKEKGKPDFSIITCFANKFCEHYMPWTIKTITNSGGSAIRVYLSQTVLEWWRLRMQYWRGDRRSHNPYPGYTLRRCILPRESRDFFNHSLQNLPCRCISTLFTGTTSVLLRR